MCLQYLKKADRDFFTTARAHSLPMPENCRLQLEYSLAMCVCVCVCVCLSRYGLPCLTGRERVRVRGYNLGRTVVRSREKRRKRVQDTRETRIYRVQAIRGWGVLKKVMEEEEVGE